MGKVKWLGILSFVSGLVLLGFQSIASIMAEGERFYNHTLVSVFGEAFFDWIEGFPIAMLRGPLDSVVEAPLYIVLIALGIFLLVIHGLFAKS